MSEFLEYDLGKLSRDYSQEDRVVIGYPYAILKTWDIVDAQAEIEPFSVSVTPGQYSPPAELPDAWRQVANLGYAALGQNGHDLAWSESKIRVSEFDPDASRMTVQRAEYDDQRRSNLILDFSVPGHPTLREMLRAEHGSRLPPLSDARLANTLGVALMVVVRRRGRLLAYCLRRARTGVAVFQDTWTCTAAGAAKWPSSDERTFYSGLVADVLSELEEEAGLRDEDLTFFMPVALGRELVRGGKPELFFLAGTNLSDHALRARRAAARANAARRTQPQEVVADSLLSPAARFIDLDEDQTDFITREASHQAAQLIIEAKRQLQFIRTDSRWD